MCSYVGGKWHLWCWAKLRFYEEILKRSTAEWVFDEVSSHTEGKRWQRGSGVCKFIIAYSQQHGEFCKSAQEKWVCGQLGLLTRYLYSLQQIPLAGKIWILKRSLLWRRVKSIYKQTCCVICFLRDMMQFAKENKPNVVDLMVWYSLALLLLNMKFIV